MENNNSSIISRVQKLLSLSKSIVNLNEAENAARAANKLIDQYRLSSADIQSENNEEDSIVEDDEFIYETGRIIPWRNALVLTLASHYGLAVINFADKSTTGRKISRFKLIGRKSDIEICHYMYEYLSRQCDKLSDIEAKGKGHVYVFSYCNGFVSGIAKQLKLSREEAVQNATSSSIVKINAREKEAYDFVNNKFNNIKYTMSTSKSRMDSSAYYKGMSQGENVKIRNGLSSRGPKMLGN